MGRNASATPNDAQNRIVDAAGGLFSHKGFEGTRVSEIAKAAEANKALIYYYFHSKQAILDHIMDDFFAEVTRIGMDFIRQNITQMVEEGKLDIQPDRMHFSFEEDITAFRDQMFGYHRKILRYMMGRREVLRILLAESLRSGSQRGALFRFFKLGEQDRANPLYSAIADADPDIAYSEETVFRKFFFSMLPMIDFAVFGADYQKLSGMGEDEMVDAYLRSLYVLYGGYFSGQDILMSPD